MQTQTDHHPEYYINREISQLAFNSRVLAQAKNENIPLLERLGYLCISTTNMDEFFEVRVAGIKELINLDSVQAGPDNLAPAEVLKQISVYAHEIVDEQYCIFNDILIPALAEENIYFPARKDWSTQQSGWLRSYFRDNLMPVISSLGLDPAHPFPKILNKSLNFIISLEGKDAFGRSCSMAIVQAPRALPRLIKLDESCAKHEHEYVFLSSIIHAYIDDLFPGMEVKGCYQFRVTRNSDLFVDEEEIVDLKRALEGELLSRRYSVPVRLEVANNCPTDMTNFLLSQFELTETDLYQVNGPVNLNRLSAVADLVDMPELKFPAFTPGIPSYLTKKYDIFSILKSNDILLHHPFESFMPVVEFVREASKDPNVLAIKQTLYRTGSDSAVVQALVKAAKAGKEVTVVIELRARFDEQDNIRLANKLQAAGAHVVYGVVGYKTHAKMIFVVRREKNTLRNYVHISTGNYHARTARVYTDYGLFTSNRAICNDIGKIFQQLTGLGKALKLKKVLQSPFTLHDGMLKLIEAEADNAKAGKEARIIAKMNAIVEPQIIQALYAASQVGVKIDLIVRGTCCLRPGIPGISDNIKVRSIIGRFLEHTRIYYFHNDNDPLVYCSSADWMARNLFQRVEACFPIEDEKLRKQIIKQGLMYYLSDNTQAWLLKSDGTYQLVSPNANQVEKSAQTMLLNELAEV